jgi:hypothetical protein
VQARRRGFIQQYFGKLLGEGRSAGMIRKDIATELMVEILTGATDALVNPRKVSELKLSVRTCLSAIISIFLEGVLTERGREKL